MAAVVVARAHGVPVPLGEPPEQPAEADRHRLLEVPRVLGGGRRRLLPLLGLGGVVDYGVAVWGRGTRSN